MGILSLIYNTGFECQMDFMFKGYQTIKPTNIKEGRKWVYDEETVFVLKQ